MAKNNNPTITVELAPPTTQQDPPTPPPAATKPVAEQVTIPVRPALTTMANLATTATAAAISTGPIGGAIIITGAAITGAALARNHHNRRRKHATNRAAGKGLPKGLGKGGSTGLGGFGRVRPGTMGGGGKPLRSTSSRSPFGRATNAIRRAIANGARRPNTTGGRRTSNVGGSRTPHGPRTARGMMGRLNRKLANTPIGQIARRVASSSAPSIRAARTAARVAGAGTLGLLGGLGWLLNRMWKISARVAWVTRHLLKPGEDPKDQEGSDVKHVADTVDDPQREDGGQTPSRPTTKGRGPAMAGDQTSGTSPASHQGTSPLFMIMKNACDQATGIQHRGNLTTRAEAYDLAAIIAMFGQVLGQRAGVYRKESLDETFVDLYVKAEAAMYAVAQQVLPLGTYFDALHPERVRDLISGSNPAAWDTTNNQTIG